MIIPTYWAECRLQHRQKTPKRRTITVKRFGWSNDNQEAAEQMARERAQQALDQLIAGQSVWRQERKVAYGGGQGLPIREEVVERQGEDVLTRNGYGALCLNTPDVFFADIDADQVLKLGRWGWMVSALISVWLGCVVMELFPTQTPMAWLGMVVLALLFVTPLMVGGMGALYRIWIDLRGGILGVVRRALADHLGRHPDHHFRIYRTPAGIRVLAMHDTMNPNGEAAQNLFAVLPCDRLYVLMCQQQQCYRARVSGKPWRMNVERLRGPQWPITDPQALERRQEWIKHYESVAPNFAACQFAEAVGDITSETAQARSVRDWHDALSEALRGKPMA